MSPREPGPGEPGDAEPAATTPLEDERSADDRDEGWGERSGSGFDDEWYLSQRPPHWD
ncbi:hypothetical protein FHR75_002841 [Kineococcus radiotolerans]|uniref:Uncharacterized protein n=1 Tax=Kineococcus radiotolerans TaxID=131568 RepID=A0A7W4XXE2_KINRA|nr:hypothetical protein [Kineococcus radiotolerans]MBB2902026.1 hypothetical protein [Kineococcus radiotolerans]